MRNSLGQNGFNHLNALPDPCMPQNVCLVKLAEPDRFAPHQVVQNEMYRGESSSVMQQIVCSGAVYGQGGPCCRAKDDIHLVTATYPSSGYFSARYARDSPPRLKTKREDRKHSSSDRIKHWPDWCPLETSCQNF